MVEWELHNRNDIWNLACCQPEFQVPDDTLTYIVLSAAMLLTLSTAQKAVSNWGSKRLIWECCSEAYM